jgi:hypothetical protein
MRESKKEGFAFFLAIGVSGRKGILPWTSRFFGYAAALKKKGPSLREMGAMSARSA